MSPYPRHQEPAKEAVIRLVGIGNAGVNITDRFAMRGVLPIHTIALNSDQQSLTASVAAQKLVLGPMTTHGLGAGGDPERKGRRLRGGGRGVPLPGILSQGGGGRNRAQDHGRRDGLVRPPPRGIEGAGKNRRESHG